MTKVASTASPEVLNVSKVNVSGALIVFNDCIIDKSFDSSLIFNCVSGEVFCTETKVEGSVFGVFCINTSLLAFPSNHSQISYPLNDQL